MFFILLLLFVALPAAEIWLLIKVGGMIGVMPTILMILFTGVAGAYLAKMEGLAVIRNIQKASVEGRIPGNEMISGVLIFVGGALLLTPGFITDCMGLLMIFPPTRMLIAISIRKYFEKRVKAGSAGFSIHSNMNVQRPKIKDPTIIDADDFKDN
ncbi:MAG TPA: FxsA family protein [bacterium]|nr:FxsA family protein [bacterium]HPS30381.1 FxsA family protein [bacterium]